jgi:Haemolymph juvenile hormone binding protein (JHBP)
MQIDKSKMTFETSRLYMYFTGLFNGKNQPLAENMNNFMNENWKDILNELKAPINDGFGKVFIKIINHIFNSFPYGEMFIN